jgi:hypothetical protein
MPGAGDEDVFERRFREIDGFDQIGKSIYDLADKGMTGLFFDS